MSQAVILCGGRGTRLSELHPDRPKALVPVAGRPFLAWQIEWLARNGISDIHLAAGYMADSIREWIEHESLPAHITMSVETRALGTGGGLKFAESHVTADSFWILNGDTLLPKLDFQGLEKRHAESSKDWITLAVTRIEDSGRYGTVEFDDAGCVTAFREKQNVAGGWINGGVYLVRKSVLEALPKDRAFSLEMDTFPVLAADRHVYAYPADPPLLDMGTPQGLRAMDAYLRSLESGVL